MHVAAALGLEVRVDDFGPAARAIAAEYDPRAATIRVNARLLAGRGDAAETIAACVAHELYHHLEHLGCASLERTRHAREERADAYARSAFSLIVDPAEIRGVVNCCPIHKRI